MLKRKINYEERSLLKTILKILDILKTAPQEKLSTAEQIFSVLLRGKLSDAEIQEELSFFQQAEAHVPDSLGMSAFTFLQSIEYDLLSVLSGYSARRLTHEEAEQLNRLVRLTTYTENFLRSTHSTSMCANATEASSQNTDTSTTSTPAKTEKNTDISIYEKPSRPKEADSSERHLPGTTPNGAGMWKSATIPSSTHRNQTTSRIVPSLQNSA